MSLTLAGSALHLNMSWPGGWFDFNVHLQYQADSRPPRIVRPSAVKRLASFSKEEALPLLRERALARDAEVAAEAVRGLASRYSREELEVFLNGHDQEL